MSKGEIGKCSHHCQPQSWTSIGSGLNGRLINEPKTTLRHGSYPVRLSSPIQGQHCSPHIGRGLDKVFYKLLVLILPFSLPQLEAHHVCGQKQTERKQTKPLTLGTWNVRTLLDCKDKKKNTEFRPERMTALVSKELSHYKIDIAALSVTRLANMDEHEEVASGYTFYWKGKLKAKKRESGVGFAMKSNLVRQLDRIMTQRLQLDKDIYTTMISVSAVCTQHDKRYRSH